jgi:hypothetical protein
MPTSVATHWLPSWAIVWKLLAALALAGIGWGLALERHLKLGNALALVNQWRVKAMSFRAAA